MMANGEMAVLDADGIPDRGPAVFAVTTSTLCLATALVAARMVCRIGIVRRFSWDDWAIVVAWLLAFGLGFAINWGTHKGLGRHDVDIAAGDRGSLRRCEYVFSILYNPALMATKTSILIFYLRLSKNTKPLLRLASYVVLGIVNLAGTILTLINIFQCQPIYAAFNDVPFQPRCIPLLTEFICSAPINIVTDLAILALPIPVLTSMRLPPRQKTVLVLTFALGVFVTVVDVVRIYYLQQAIYFVPTTASSDAQAIFGDSPEFSWNASLSLMWSAVEVNVGITCACIPTLKPLIMRILPSMLVDPDCTRSGSNQTQQDKETMGNGGGSIFPSAAATPKQAAFGAGGGLQAPPPMHHHRHNHKHSRNGSASEDNGGEMMSALDFLTTPDMVGPDPGRMQPQQTATTLGSWGGSGPVTAVYFGFVNITRPKSMLKASVSDSFKYCTLVTVLFLLWGFSYGLLNTLNNVAAAVANMSVAQTLGLTSVYFGGGYFFGPLVVGGWILRHDEHHRSRRGAANHKRRSQGGESVGGFKATFMLGLCIFGVGTIMFWPAAVLASFPGFLICNFVVGFGLAVLETAANPFLALCGPAPYAEMRLCLAQGVQAVGSVLSGLLAQHVYFPSIVNRPRQQPAGSTTDSTVLIEVQWTYLAVTLLCVALALLFYYVPLPEVTEAELERAASRLPVDPNKRGLGGLKLRTVCIALAVLAQWTYVAAQESMSIYFRSLITAYVPTQPAAPDAAAPPAEVTSGSGSDAGRQPDQPPGLAISVPDYLVIAHTAFAVSRFAAGYLAYLSVRHPRSWLVPTPRTVLLAAASMQVACAAATVAVRPGGNPNLMSVPVILFFLAEGPSWPLIFALGLRGQGDRTKLAAAWLTMGASGPAFWPFVIYAIVERGGSVQTAFGLVVALLCFTLAYPLYLTFVRDARALVDPGASSPSSAAGGLEVVEGGERRQQQQQGDINDILARRGKRQGSRSTAGQGGFLARLGPTRRAASGPAAAAEAYGEDKGGLDHAQRGGGAHDDDGGPPTSTSAEPVLGQAAAAGSERTARNNSGMTYVEQSGGPNP